MSKRLLFVCLLLVVVALSARAVPGDQAERPLFAPHIVKLQLTPEAQWSFDMPSELYGERQSFGIEALDRLMQSFGKATIHRAHIELKNPAFDPEGKLQGWVFLKYEQALDVRFAVESFKALQPWIQEAVPEYYAYTQFVPNDPYYPNNWGHNNTGQLPVYQGGSHSGPGVGTPGFDARAQLAWDDVQGMGSAAIVIAIIDTGVDTAHPDLRLVPGYDYGDNDSNPMDNSAQAGHGTACSGVAAARGNNNLGIAGIAAGCSVMPLKVADTAGNLQFTYIENALIHCANNNVRIASLSLGAENTSYGSYPSTDAAINAAYNAGVAIFAATANGNLSSIAYPANHPYIISVGAASPTGQRKSPSSSDGENWWGSNYGVNTQDSNNAVDIMGPTILPATDITGNAGYASGDYSLYFNGTSCATPYVAGVGALVLSKAPELSPSQLRTALTSTARDMTIDGGVGWDRFTGYGMVNAAAALAYVTPGMPFCRIDSPQNGATLVQGELVAVNVTATDSNGSITAVAFYLNDSLVFTDYSAPYSWSWNTASYATGSYSIRAVATDNEANTSSSEINVFLQGPADEGFESGDFSLYSWEMSGNQGWLINSQSYSGNYAAKSGGITHNQTSSMAISLDVSQAGTISFYRLISSESGYDYLRFYIDNQEMGEWSGSSDWVLQSYPVAVGSRTFRWTYSKDGSVSSGQDAAFIDHINFPPTIVISPPQITWNPGELSIELAPDASTTAILLIGNSGEQELQYSLSMPAGDTVHLDESFESGSLPAGWVNERVGSSTVDWAFVSGGISGYPTGAADGSLNARLYRNSSTAQVTRLITPQMDLSGATSASLSFWHAQVVWAGDQDELRVYYKNSPSGNWILLAEYTGNVASWTQREIALPALSSTYYIAFAGTTRYGYGVCLDKVVVSATGAEQVDWLSINGGVEASGSIAPGEASQSISLYFDSNSLASGVYETELTLTSNSAVDGIVSIPVSLTVASTPQISLSTTELDFGLVRLGESSQMSFQISNSGSATLTGTINSPDGFSVNAARDSAIPSASRSSEPQRQQLGFTVPSGESRSYSLGFSPTEFRGYDADLVISHNAGDDSVIALIAEGGASILGLSQTEYSFELAPGELSSEYLAVSNYGNLSLDYSYSVATNYFWLSVNGARDFSGNLGAGTDHEHQINIDAYALPPGEYEGIISGTSNDPENPFWEILVTLWVREPLSLLSPQAEETFTAGAAEYISWDYSGSGSSVNLFYRVADGDWIAIASPASEEGINQYLWTLPQINSTLVQVRITDSVDPFYSELSGYFSIEMAVAPTAPENLQILRDPETGDIQLSWGAAENNPDAYHVQHCPSPAFEEGTYTLVAVVPASETQFTVLEPAELGFYRVIAVRN